MSHSRSESDEKQKKVRTDLHLKLRQFGIVRARPAFIIYSSRVDAIRCHSPSGDGVGRE